MINYVLCCQYRGFYAASSPLNRTLERRWGGGVTSPAPQGGSGVGLDLLLSPE